MPHKINLVDKDGNQSEVTLPDYALDSTQQQLLKNIQAMVRANPKAQKAYEELISATKDAVTATEDASEQQKKDAKALQDAVDRAGEKQVSALRQFRTNFADRIGRDMRDTFTAGGNILTAAIQTATVGLAASAGLLYKTFMDTSEAFRSLAQSGLGGAGASGTEAQDAVANLTRLGMSASEAANMLTSFGQASAVLGKANFSKFVSGIANAGSFAAELGLTLEEAAEYAAEEVDMRQRALVGRLRLDGAQSQSIMEAIAATQTLAGIMGKSMKDINASGKEFVDNNANLASFLNSLPEHMRANFVDQMTMFGKEAGAIGGDYEKLLKSLMNAALLQVPLQDENMKGLYKLGTGGQLLAQLFERTGAQVKATGQLDKDTRASIMTQAMDIIRTYNVSEQELLSIQRGKGNQFAEAFLNASVNISQGEEKLRKYFKESAKAANDPMVTAAANFQNALNRVTGVFITIRNQVLGQFADPLNKVLDQFQLTGDDLKKYNEQRAAAINADKNLTEEQKKQQIASLRNKSLVDTLYDGIGKIADSFMKKFFPNLNSAGDKVGAFVDIVVVKVDEFLTGVNDFINGLEGDTTSEKIIDAISKGMGLLFEKGVAIVWATLKTIVINHWDSLFKAIGLLMTAAFIKAGIGALISTVFAKQSATAAASSAASIKSAGNTLALAIRQVAMAVRRAAAGLGVTGGLGGPMGDGPEGKGKGKAGRFGRFMRGMGGKLSVAGIATGLLGGIAADKLEEAGHTKTATAVNVGTQAVGMAGTGALIGSMIAPGIGTAIGGVAGGLIGGGMALYDAWSQSKEAEQAVAEKGKEAIEGIDGAGMAAMAMDPAHIKAVSIALKDFNAVSVTNITAGLTAFNPVLTALFDVITKVKTQFIEIVNVKLGAFLNIIKGLNTQGAILPETTEYINNLASTIIAIPIDPIVKLSTAFNALTTALKDFGDLTTSNRFGRMWDAFTGKEDQTEGVIKVLNNFADKVNSDKLLSAAQATQAYVTSMQGMANLVEPQRSSPTNTNPTANQNTTTTTNTNPQMVNANAEMERLLRLIEIGITASEEHLRTIKKNTTKEK